MKLWHAPTGKVIRGHVLDVSHKNFTRALQDFDKNLIAVWNPKKLQGWGCWEIRRTLDKKVATYQGRYKGIAYYKLEAPKFTHHIVDAAFLNLDVIRHLKTKDLHSFMEKHGLKTSEDLERWMDRRAAEYEQEERAKAAAELRYAIKENKSMARDFIGAVQSGIHPAQVLLSSKWQLK